MRGSSASAHTSPVCFFKGYFQALFWCIERLLASLNVENIVLPAAEEAESIWTNKFGFTKMSEERVSASPLLGCHFVSDKFGCHLPIFFHFIFFPVLKNQMLTACGVD